ncbi:MAG: DUF434 domain-containing protein, partial [Bacteroidota bacterium]
RINHQDLATRNRGKQPNDDKLFATKWHPIFKEAVDDLCFLRSRGYAEHSSVEIVGNRYRLNKRQRHAIRRIYVSKQDFTNRKSKELIGTALVGKKVEIDGFNLLILLESALSGAYIFRGRDGTIRDVSSVHGSYKRVQKTERAIHLVGEVLQELQVAKTHWYFDKPVSNSGRLKTMLYEISTAKGFNWDIDLVYEPDKVLARSEAVVVTADGWILNECKQWYNLGADLVDHHLTDYNLIEV